MKDASYPQDNANKESFILLAVDVEKFELNGRQSDKRITITTKAMININVVNHLTYLYINLSKLLYTITEYFTFKLSIKNTLPQLFNHNITKEKNER